MCDGDIGGNQFVTTRWSVVLSSAGAIDGVETAAHEALAQLCRTYWRPIFAFICRRGHSAVDAQDLTQDFFAMVLTGNLLRQADRNRGRFRSLLLASVHNFLHDAADKARARKRGGHMQFVSWDEWMAEAPSHLSIAPSAIESLPAERLFDLRWAATVVEQSLRRLGEECESRGRRRVFDALRAYLTGEGGETSYASAARSLAMPEGTVKTLVHRMRQRYRTILREEVADTVNDPAEVDDEIRHLCAVLATGAERL